MARRIAIFITVIFVTLGLAVAGTLMWMTSDEGARFISSELKKNVSEKTGIEVSFAKIEIDLFPPRIRVQGITGKDSRISCSVDEAELAPSIIALFSRVLAIEEVYLGSPRCDIDLKAADIDKLTEKRDDSDTDTPFDIDDIPDFEVFAISDAALKLTISDPGRIGTLDAEMAGFGIDVTRDDDEMEVRFLLERLAGIWKDGEKRAEERITSLQFRAAVSKGAVDVRHLSAGIAEADLKLRDAHIPLPLWPVGPNVAEVSLSSSLEILNRLPLDLPQFKGAVSYNGQLGVEKDAEGKIGFTAKGRFQLFDGGVDDFVIGSLDAHVAVTPKAVAFEKAVLKAAEGRLEIVGSIALDDRLTSDLDLNLDKMNLAHILEQATVDGSYVTQVMSGPVKLKGTLNPLRLNGNVKIDVRDHTTRTDSFRARNPTVAIYIPKALVSGGITITDEIFEAKSLKVKSGSSNLTVALMFNFPGFFWRLHALSDDLYLEDVDKILGFSVAGHGPVECLIQGPINDPHIKGSGNFKQAVLEGMAVDQVSTSVKFGNLELRFDDLKVNRNQSHISTKSLLFDFNAKGGLRIKTKINAKRASVEDVMAAFDIDRRQWGDISGLLYGDVDVDYYLKPERLHVSADVAHDKLQIFGEHFGPDVAKIDWDDGELEVHEFGLTKGKGTISITGHLDEKGEMSFTGVASGVNLDAINYEAVKALEADAALQAFVVMEGTLDHPKGTADLRLGNLVRKGTRYGPSAVKLKIDNTSVTGKGNLVGDKIVLEHLLLDLKRERFEIESFVNEVELLRILDVDVKENNASVLFTGDLALHGRISDDLQLGGRAELMKVRVQFNDLTFENKVPLRLRARNNRFRFAKTRFFGPDVIFDFSGTLSPEKLGLKVKGLADLKSVSSMVSGIRKTKGTLAFEVRASGDPSKPTFRGEASLSDGLLRLDAFPDDIKQISGEITLSPKVVRVLDFSAETAGGTLGMNGEITLNGTSIESYVFSLFADDLSLTPIENLTLKTSTIKDGLVLRSSNNDGIPSVSGDLEIRDLRYTEDIRLFELSDLTVDQLSGTRTTARRPKLLDPKKDFFSFDIHLHGTKNIEAHNNLFDAELSIDDREKPLRFVGTNQNFGFLGRILGKEGQVRFAGRRFEVKYAAIDFQDPDRPENPYFQVISDGKIRDWKVTMTAEGTVDEYELKFASQPYLPKEDIAFLIMTGLTQAENRQFSSSAFKLGMPFLGQFGPGGGSLPVELQVYSEYSETAGKDTTKIAMGRWVTEDIWVSISSGVGQTRDVGAQVDYKINDEFSLSVDYEDEDEGSTGNVGLDLKFRLEF